MPARSSAESSAITMRMAAPPSRSWAPSAGLDTVNVPRAARTRSSRPRRPVASSAAATVRAADAVVEHRDVQCVGRFVEPHGDDRLGGARVFGDVGQRLGDDEVGDRLDFVGQPVRQVDVESRRHAGGFDALHDRGQRGVQAAVGEDRRGDAADHVAQFDERALGVVVRLGDQLAWPRAGRCRAWSAPARSSWPATPAGAARCRAGRVRCGAVRSAPTPPRLGGRR